MYSESVLVREIFPRTATPRGHRLLLIVFFSIYTHGLLAYFRSGNELSDDPPSVDGVSSSREFLPLRATVILRAKLHLFATGVGSSAYFYNLACKMHEILFTE